jgi:hypothetical protein
VPEARFKTGKHPSEENVVEFFSESPQFSQIKIVLIQVFWLFCDNPNQDVHCLKRRPIATLHLFDRVVAIKATH